MSCAQTENLQICRGKTFTKVIRWEDDVFKYAPITSITRGAPTVITAPVHEIPPRWRAAVVSVGGMTQLNAATTPPKAKDFRPVTVVDANTIELNEVNSSGFKPYTSGGYLQYRTPVDLTAFIARMYIKDRVGGTVLLSLTSGAEIIIDPIDHYITITLDAATTEALTWTSGVYDLEMVSINGVVTALIEGVVTVEDEVTVL